MVFINNQNLKHPFEFTIERRDREKGKNTYDAVKLETRNWLKIERALFLLRTS